LIERVTVAIQEASENVNLRIDWVGGTSSEHSWRRRIGSYEQMTDFTRLRERVKSLVADGKTASQIAEQLNREGFRPVSERVERYDQRLASGLI
jgi:DNA-binding NarL/FixJ family response regulator